jgi:hypothetical protein
MHLVQLQGDGECKLVTFVSRNIPPYAILSHTWGPDHEEVTYQDLQNGTARGKRGFVKLQFCGTRAQEDGLRHFWIDTCCIKKDSSAELSESLNSMFRWYRSAVKCYVYISDDISQDDLFQSRWFNRGWTLQELLAPRCVEFFTRDGVRLGDKSSLELEIHEKTGIPIAALQGRPLAEFTVTERMAWAEHRDTTLEEDRVYCLLGIFDAYMPVIYGEGYNNARRRLEREMAVSSCE